MHTAAPLAPGARSTTRGRWINFALVLVSATLSLLLAEGAVRLFFPNQARDSEFTFFQYDPELGWANKPNSAGTFRVPGVVTEVHINSQGWRDREYPASTPGQTRIVVLGDSMTWGYGVGDQERYTDQLQRARPDARVLNMGVSGYGTAQEYLLLRQNLDAYRPDLVIVGFYYNDLVDNVSDNNGEAYAYPRPVLALSGGTLALGNVPVPRRDGAWQRAPVPSDGYGPSVRWLAQHSQLFLSVARPAAAAFNALAIRRGWRSEARNVTDPASIPWRTTFAILTAMKTDLDARGIKLLVVVVPSKYNIDRKLTYAEDNMRRWGAASGVAVLTPADQFTQTDTRRLFLRYDSHLSTAGHALLGDLIRDALGRK